MLSMALKMTILVVCSRKKEVIMGHRPASGGWKVVRWLTAPAPWLLQAPLNPKTFWLSIYSWLEPGWICSCWDHRAHSSKSQWIVKQSNTIGCFWHCFRLLTVSNEDKSNLWVNIVLLCQIDKKWCIRWNPIQESLPLFPFSNLGLISSSSKDSKGPERNGDGACRKGKLLN